MRNHFHLIVIIFAITSCIPSQKNEFTNSEILLESMKTDPKNEILISERDKFYTYINTRFNGTTEDSIFSDTFSVQNTKIVLQSIAQDSCLNLMFTSDKLTYSSACLNQRSEYLNEYSTRLNDTSLVITFGNGKKDTLFNMHYKAFGGWSNSYDYVDYISKYSYHILAYQGYESCGYKIMIEPNEFINIRVSQNLSFNLKSNLILASCESIYDLGSFIIYSVKDNDIVEILNYNQQSVNEFYWDIKTAYWINDSTISIITGRQLSDNSNYNSYALLKLLTNNSN